MTRRQELTAAQLGTLFDPVTEQRDMVRHYMARAVHVGADLAAATHTASGRRLA